MKRKRRTSRRNPTRRVAHRDPHTAYLIDKLGSAIHLRAVNYMIGGSVSMTEHWTKQIESAQKALLRQGMLPLEVLSLVNECEASAAKFRAIRDKKR